ncbi:hypothetical protein C8255_23295 [filamentous cyanobacterium CCP3]|nr:hypothetical protein C8255_23295 [filamentous cyanobacterium CCP3]
MIENNSIDKRHVLPRWLSVSKAIEAGYFRSAAKAVKTTTNKALLQENALSLITEFRNAMEAWQNDSSVSNAEEFLSVSLVAQKVGDRSVVDAAHKIVSSKNSSMGIIAIAQALTSGSPFSSISDDFLEQANLQIGIQKKKKLLEEHPRDSLLIMELALAYTNLGQFAAAENLVNRAVSLTPNSRFVLRSTARFLCHRNKPDEALSLLQRSPRIDSDAWIKSAELAIAGLIQAPIQNWRKSRALAADTSLPPRDRSELISEIATLEFASGARRAGLKQVRNAVEDPTENAIAQIAFLSGETNNFSIEDVLHDISGSMEAQSLDFYRKGQLKSAFEACLAWRKVEPFSIRPAVFGSFLSTTKQNSVDLGIELAKNGLRSNPGHPILLNNLAVLLAYKGDVANAAKYAEQSRSNSPFKNDIAGLATRGLINFRQGRHEEGNRFYEMAIEKAIDQREMDMALRAYAFLSREIIRIDPKLTAQIRDQFKEIETKIGRSGRKLPADVAIIVGEFSDQAAVTESLLSDFTKFPQSYIDKIL